MAGIGDGVKSFGTDFHSSDIDTRGGQKFVVRRQIDGGNGEACTDTEAANRS